MDWRSKFVCLLIVYGAGFATAIYCLAPAPEPQPQPSFQVAQLGAALNTQELVKSFNSGMHKCLGFSKDAAVEAAQFLQTRMQEAAKSQSKG